MTRWLEGKRVIVTGAGRGIGREEALTLARLGALVVVNDVRSRDGSSPAEDVVAEIRREGGVAECSEHDVSRLDEARRLVAVALNHFGGLDGVVNNAGILRDHTVIRLTSQEWDSVMAVHLRGHFNLTRLALKHWRDLTKASGRPVTGRLVHTSSESGLYGAPGQSNYDAAKGGIAAFSIAVAREGRRYGVTSNAICPRAYTRMTSANFDHAGDHEAAERLHPRLVVPWVAFLLSDDAGDITGQCFVVGGGLLRLVEYWPVVADTAMPDADDIDGLKLAAARLFEGRSSQPTQFPRVVPGLG